MKFSEAYKEEMDNIEVSETTVNKINTYSSQITCKMMKPSKINSSKMKFIRTAVVAACTFILLTTVYYHRDNMHAFAQSIFGNFILDLWGKQVELGEIEPIKFNLDEFIADANVNVLLDENNNKTYWKNYGHPNELEKETGIVMITSALLEVPSDRDSLNVHIMANGYGHLNGDFIYGEYHVNVDGMFTYEGYQRDQSGYGYGISEEEKYDFAYEASNGIKVYFVRHSNGQKLIFQAGNLLYQVNTDAPVKEVEKLIETFEF